MPAPHPDSPERARTFLRFLILAAVVLAPLPFGGVIPIAVFSVQLVSVVAGMTALILLRIDPLPRSLRYRPVLIPVGIVLLVGVVQLLPLPDSIVESFAGPSYRMREAVAQVVPEAAVRSTLSASPSSTVDALLRFTAYALLGLASMVAIRRRAHLIQLMLAITASGMFQAVYGVAEYLSGRQQIFGYAKRFFLDEASGTFINRNHFAGYLAVILPVAAGLVLEGIRTAGWKGGWRTRLVEVFGRGGVLVVLGTLAFATIWLGVILSYSRSGLVVALAGILALVVGLEHRRRRSLPLALAIVAPVIVLLFLELRAPGERFLGNPVDLASVGGRSAVWLVGLRMVPSYLPFGSGYGTFAEVFPLFRPTEVRFIWDHIHNDWLQSMIEGGPLVPLALAYLLVLAYRRMRQAGDPLRVALATSIVAAAVLAIVDFGLRLPGIAVLVATIAGAALGQAPSGKRVLS